MMGTVNVNAQSGEKVVGVPWDFQHKDTNMVCLQGCDYSGDHAWDSEHLEHRTHGDMYCVRASISMIANYFNDKKLNGGTLSQDRITYHMTEDGDLGPDFDLKHSETASPVETLAWALGIEADAFIEYQYFGRIIYTSEFLEDNRVILGVWDGHARVIDGYKLTSSGNYLHILDPWPLTEPTESEKWVSGYDVPQYAYFIVTPAQAPGVREDEESIWMDSDWDGLCDFDEQYRFYTDPYEEDSDNDSIGDKEEILSYTYDYWGNYGPGYFYDYIVQKLSEDYPIMVDGIPVALYCMRGNTPIFPSTKLDFVTGDDIGWHRNQPLIDLIELRSDMDGDGLRAELDSDSDGDGIPDNGEDKNRNGLFEWWLDETNPHIWDTISPTTTIDVSPEFYISDSANYVTQDTVFSLQSKDDARSQWDIDHGILDRYNEISTGIEAVFYKYYPVDNVDPLSFSYYREPFQISGPNGEYIIEYYAMDKHGNRESVHTVSVVLSDTIGTGYLFIEGLEYSFSPFFVEPVLETYILEWSFGPTSPIKTGKTPLYTFPDNGLYQITLNAFEDTTLLKTQFKDAVVLDTSPVADFSTLGTYQEGSPIQFTDETNPGNDPIVSWSWDFDGKTSSSLQNPVHIFYDDGVYNVSLTVTDDDGSESSIIKQVTITNEAPSLILNIPIEVVEGVEYKYNLTINDPGVLDYHSIEWDYGDNSIPKGYGEEIADPMNRSHIYTHDGVYTLTVTVTDDGGATTVTSATITVEEKPLKADFSWTPEPQFEGSSVVFNDLSTSQNTLASWSWEFSELEGSYEKDPGFTFADDGVYPVILTVTDDGGFTDIIAHEVTILNEAPTINQIGCYQPYPCFILPMVHTLDFTATFSDPGWIDTHTATWDWGDGLTSEGVIVEEHYEPDSTGTITGSHVYKAPGDYTVTVTVTDDDGGSDSEIYLVHVNTQEESVQLLNEYIKDLGECAFDKKAEQTRKTLGNMLNAVLDKLMLEEYCGAINHLTSIRGKIDDSKNSWISDVETREELAMMIDDIIHYLKTRF